MTTAGIEVDESASGNESQRKDQRSKNGHARGGGAAAGQPLNVGDSERVASVAAGSLLALLGLSRRDLLGLAIAGIGGGMIYRGATGHCPAYGAAGIDTKSAEHSPEKLAAEGTHVATSFLIDRNAEDLYGYWRDFENLPQIMTFLQSVTVSDNGRSHWVAKAPKIAGGQVEWDAQIVEDRPNERIAWRSLPGSGIHHAGSVEFVKAPGDRGTIVRVQMDYITSAGAVGRWAAKLSGQSPERQIHEDLRNFKRFMEAGELPTITGQPRGNCLGSAKKRS